jgi:hypothetical protein
MVESSPHAEDHKGSWAGHIGHGGIGTKFRDNDLYSLPTKAKASCYGRIFTLPKIDTPM